MHPNLAVQFHPGQRLARNHNYNGCFKGLNMDTQDPEFGRYQVDYGSLLTEMAKGFGQQSLGSLMAACSPLPKKLDGFCPVKSAAAFGGLLLRADCQKHCLRIELLIHMAIAAGNGKRSLPPAMIVHGFHVAGRAVGVLEDPPEDVLVQNISSRRGNYRILPGIWEGAGFYLQRFVNLLDDMPVEGNFKVIADAGHALLKVSELLCSRAGLRRNLRGTEMGLTSLPLRMASKAAELRNGVGLTTADLRAIDVDVEDLRPFMFTPQLRQGLSGQSFGNTDLERRPLVMVGDTLYLVLPTAVSLAIRWWCLRSFSVPYLRASLRYNLAIEYVQLLDDAVPLTSRQPLSFTNEQAAPLAHLTRMVDAGRWLNMVFVLDSLQDFADGGFAGVDKMTELVAPDVSRIVEQAQQRASESAGFESGITLLVCCGVGRGMGMTFVAPPRADWKIEAIAIHDLCTLSHINGFKTLDLWRLWESEMRLQGSNVWLQNANGLLNMYAWTDALNGHMIPHADIPVEASGTSLVVSITQNGLLDLRNRALLATDEHAREYVDGSWFMIRKEEASYFEEDDLQPLYGSVNAPGRPKGAFLTNKRCWWSELASPIGGPDTESYDRWKMVATWLVRCAPVLEHALAEQLGHGPILWRCVFVCPPLAGDLSQWGNEADARDAITCRLDPQLRTVELLIDKGLDQAIYHPDNIAERALVRGFVEGVVTLAGAASGLVESLVAQIVPNTQARHAHVFPVRSYRDAITELASRSLITISRLDDAADCLGMGWAVRGREHGGRITGKAECLAYFGQLVGQLQRDLCEQLRRFDRESVVRAVLENHEVAGVSRDRWHRTAAAVLALRENQTGALSAMRDHEYRLNAVFQPSRNLLEMALCESPLGTCKPLGKLDLAKLLAKASRLYHIGGWSDLIRWDLMKPIVIIRPLGDVHVQQDFIDTVMEGYGSATSAYRYRASVRRYDKNLQQPKVSASVQQDVDIQFNQAWLEEFGVDLDAYRRFLDALEDYGIDQQQAVLAIRRSQVLTMADSIQTGLMILEHFVLVPRQAWADVPHGFDQKDIDPWRFRRRLSALRRPIFQLDLEDDPMLILAPGLVREGFAATVQSYYSGSYPDRHLGNAMKRYAGYARNRDGMAFNAKVLARLTELGWQTAAELKLTKILKQSLDRDYGDVDVLAWSPEQKRVLIIECKDLQFRKTYGEIAEQLSDFRNVEVNGKRDLLRKHLDRVRVLREYQGRVGAFVGIAGDFTVESVVVFSFPVPMQFASGAIRELAQLHTYSSLEDLRC
ncbi:SEC-C motif domain protein [Pseudomonas syringae pv. tomato T1]|nr:SEC-C motif domain protein [Pseudomonas syringae pv. tomato T1]